MTNCKDTSGMCYGDGFIWSGANGGSVNNPPDPPINGIFQTDMNGKQSAIARFRSVPRTTAARNARHGVADRTSARSGSHANRLGGAMIRIDPKTWEVDYLVPEATNLERRGCTASPTTTATCGR